MIDLFDCSDEDDVIDCCRDCDAIVVEYAPMTQKVMDNLPKLKVISVFAIGYDSIDVKMAEQLGIAVANVPGYCAQEVADHTMGFLLAAERCIVHFDRKIRAGIWDLHDAPRIHRNAGKTLGLIGFGNIGQEVAKRAQVFGMRILVCDPMLDGAAAIQAGVEFVSLEALLERADIISLHLPLTEQRYRFFNDEIFGKMKRQPLFINTARGGLVDESALCRALKNGLVRGACLDVMDPVPEDFTQEIFHLPNVIINPHAAFYSEEALIEVRERGVLNAVYHLNGEYEKVNYVNKWRR